MREGIPADRPAQRHSRRASNHARRTRWCSRGGSQPRGRFPGRRRLSVCRVEGAAVGVQGAREGAVGSADVEGEGLSLLVLGGCGAEKEGEGEEGGELHFLACR